MFLRRLEQSFEVEVFLSWQSVVPLHLGILIGFSLLSNDDVLVYALMFMLKCRQGRDRYP